MENSGFWVSYCFFLCSPLLHYHYVSTSLTMQIPTEALSQSHRLCFTGKERDSETGFSYFGARYYDSDLMTGWLSVDPMVDKFPNISPYAYCTWNPIKLVDPDGEEIGDYYAMNGWGRLKKIGSDGNNDKQTYLVTNSNDVSVIKENKKNGQYTSTNDLFSLKPLPSKMIRKEMLKVVECDQMDNMREYGGKGFLDENGEMFIREVEDGKTWDGFGNAEIDMTKLKDNSGINSEAIFFYHSHLSGIIDIGVDKFNFISHKLTDADMKNISISNRKYDYMFGLYGNPRVYIYNASGIRASLTLDEFKNIGE